MGWQGAVVARQTSLNASNHVELQLNWSVPKLELLGLGIAELDQQSRSKLRKAGNGMYK